MCFYSNLLQLILHSAARVIFLKHAVSLVLKTLEWFLLAIKIVSASLGSLGDLAFPTCLPSLLPFTMH